MRIRFQADADLNQVIVRAVVRREPSLDFRTATRAELAGLDDSAVLALAAREGRVLVSHDKKTLPYHFADFTLRQKSAGLILLPQSLPIVRAAEDLVLVWSATEAEEWENRIAYLPL